RSSLFVLLLHLSPSFTLVPYTTLFRSVLSQNDRTSLFEALDDGAIGGRNVVAKDLRAEGVGHAGEVEQVFHAERYADGTVVQRLDRKSTRLNSSHGSISYAVFCLKKKK